MSIRGQEARCSGTAYLKETSLHPHAKNAMTSVSWSEEVLLDFSFFRLSLLHGITAFFSSMKGYKLGMVAHAKTREDWDWGDCEFNASLGYTEDYCHRVGERDRERGNGMEGRKREEKDNLFPGI